MSTNPWKPPSGWDEAEGVGAPWTIRGVLRSMARALRGQPFAVILAVFVLPGLWSVPSNLANELFAIRYEAASVSGLYARVIGMRWAGVAWECVWAAGQLCAAIAAVRGQPIRWREFVSGIARAPTLLLVAFVVFFPLEVIAFAPAMRNENARTVAELLWFVAMAYAIARTLFWAPLIVDARRPFWESLATSLTWTSGHAWKIVVLVATMGILSLPFAVVEFLIFGEQRHLFWAVLSSLTTLAAAAAYVEMPVAQVGASDPEP